MTSTVNYSERIDRLRTLLDRADAIVIGAGSGLSAAAGLDYAGADFEREFRPWIERYGFTDLYSSSFHPFDTEEERWAYWARHIWFARFSAGATALYTRLRQVVAARPHFVITTNVDGQFELSGFDSSRIFATQGDLAYLQSRSGRNRTLVYDRPWVTEALKATHGCRIPAALVPRHPETGELMSPNLRCDATFVEDDRWHRQAGACRSFMERAMNGNLLLLEFGVGFNTPSIIRFPFEEMAADNANISLVRFNRDFPHSTFLPDDAFTSFTEDVSDVLSRLTAD